MTTKPEESNFPIIVFVKEVTLDKAIRFIPTTGDLPCAVGFVVLETKAIKENVNKYAQVVGLTLEHVTNRLKGI